VPEGGLQQADNVVINYPNVIESRRGFNYYTSSFTSSTSRAAELYVYSDKLWTQRDATLSYDTGAALSDLAGSYSPAASWMRMKSVQAAENFYLATSTGVMVSDSAGGRPRGRGCPPG
jgi:hypothetical protein